MFDAKHSAKKINEQGKSVQFGKSGQFKLRTGVRAGS